MQNNYDDRFFLMEAGQAKNEVGAPARTGAHRRVKVGGREGKACILKH
jgi:hypothetical protein